MAQRKRFSIFLSEAERRAVNEEAYRLEISPSEFMRAATLSAVGLPATPTYRRMTHPERKAAGYRVGATE